MLNQNKEVTMFKIQLEIEDKQYKIALCKGNDNRLEMLLDMQGI